MTKKIAVLGAGSWGSTLASVLIENGHDVTLYTNVVEQAAELNEKHTNEQYMPGFKYSEKLRATTDLEEALTDTDAILFVVPTKVTRLVAKQVKEVLAKLKQRPMVIHASKGLEIGTHKRISEIIHEELTDRYCSSIVVLSGPSHAEEVARHDITLITAASEEEKAAEQVQDMFTNNYLRIYTNNDVVGVETGAAFKNVIAIGAGILHGLGYGDDAKAALMTRGLAEVARLGMAYGASPLTFMGLSGVGDLIVTCTSVHSRNWRCGDQLGQGKPLDEVIEDMGMVIEGINTAKAAYDLSREEHIEMPITEAIYNVLYNKADIKEEIGSLMTRDSKSEVIGKRK
ncbi:MULTISPECIES: NAD(P)H-dependent glycerol-3-phosphate dehydrogenase [Ligilactobacillus]|uniref:Glycerol-3-phosphate dehydrogenase [NAD(P)+] n=1 Tax=Ligilactobacillus animalis TaxID=1605 RepID=A0AAJ6K1S3_9LACO|nr:NAD(P)H-dependent glycerol-3-phosphate dehydrogenase [Ligilactobacillus animalis]KDA45787.1 glycerol-3-phosphate dehydrogenase (NAD(+)) [Ligilactobacillus animalis]MBU5279797.1 NAD(P)H-dependent glycerol-3-phosphate dehydrogenase [Ligilactobacillus animalis]MDQ2234661.1 NAD(P)H-dependent glycerol-3-phosphate dehydrogenase [Ligilactobacillus animalis]MDU3187552.1 NAD(P)H-dependent glycerol-3-phosphate dehydrogenase [Ligilactobacillus animalis]MEE0260989.1 NAD(P)H-dependent glycerol-3-phospha